MSKKPIKRLGTLDNKKVSDEVDHLINQLEHKDNIVTKQPGRTGTITIAGITKIHVKNGQITGWE